MVGMTLIHMAALPVSAQPYTLGVLFWHESPNDQATLQGFREGLDAAGRRYRLIVRRADSDPECARAHLAEFGQKHVDLVVALGTEATRLAALHRPPGVPVVFTAVTDPVNSGIVPDWKGSGSFLAGNSNHIDPHRVLDVFRTALPGLRTLGVLHSKDNPVSRAEIQGVQAALKERASLGIRLVVREVSSPASLENAADALLADCDALWIPIDFGVYSHLDEVASVARKHKKPIVTTTPRAVPHAVVAVLPDYHTLGMQAVEIADQILRRGVEPGAIPVGLLKGRLLVINLGAARAIGLPVPIQALASADRIVNPRCGSAPSSPPSIQPVEKKDR
jgi:putative tryptophan/tyrosine transport system substrate-binding protein